MNTEASLAPIIPPDIMMLLVQLLAEMQKANAFLQQVVTNTTPKKGS